VLDVGLREAPPAHRAFVVAADRGDAAVERHLVTLDDGDGDADRQEIHRDAAAHRSGTENADAVNRDPCGVRRDIVDTRCRGFGRQNVRLHGCGVVAVRRDTQALFANHLVPLRFQKISNRPAAPIPPAQHIVTTP
jgi:hypothetical protein